MSVESYSGAVLPPGVRSRFADGGNGLRMHVLEAGFEPAGRPAVLLLHGFPELAWSWRKVLPSLAAAGFHVVAPDQRGYGRTTGWDADYDGDLAPFAPVSLVRDLLGLVAGLGLRTVRAVVGHDFGSPIAAHCALLRPDVFTSLVMMSAPFGGPPPPGPPPPGSPAAAGPGGIDAGLAALRPPRKHYQWYYSTRQANADLLGAPQGLGDFLRAYYHVKSADWPGNQPHPLGGWTAAELARLPAYYVMPAAAGMAQAVAPFMPSAEQVADCAWLTGPELEVYRAEFARTGFQGGLQWYRCATSGLAAAGLLPHAGQAITVPALFIAGAADWGTYQVPGAYERLGQVCADLRGRHLIPAAGHWVQQEQAPAVTRILLDFLAGTARAGEQRG